MSDHEHNHTSTLGYLAVFAALLVLTGLTWYTAVFWDLPGYGNILLALAIACLKANLVLYFFMHLRESPRIVKVAGVTGFCFVAILLAFFITDQRSRNGRGTEIPEGSAWPVTDPGIAGPDFQVIVGPPEQHGH